VRAEDSHTPFALLSERINDDLFETGGKIRDCVTGAPRLRPIGKLSYLRAFGCRTLVSPSEFDRSALHEPWATSGFMLAPMLQGFVMSYFRGY
jgi:hypothetical protein